MAEEIDRGALADGGCVGAGGGYGSSRGGRGAAGAARTASVEDAAEWAAAGAVQLFLARPYATDADDAAMGGWLLDSARRQQEGHHLGSSQQFDIGGARHAGSRPDLGTDSGTPRAATFQPWLCEQETRGAAVDGSPDGALRSQADTESGGAVVAAPRGRCCAGDACGSVWRPLYRAALHDPLSELCAHCTRRLGALTDSLDDSLRVGAARLSAVARAAKSDARVAAVTPSLRALWRRLQPTLCCA
eukprot:652313-Prymnesium_polylepis.1